ncbi:Translocon at the outer membrane of chloroplasts 64 [Morella rubra]|uniref:Translocon at the outer membrane of chloroplasts 64 n=1 Tax=Morella rubra TaxID=262757 RepID=A0A6A1VK45_9ROSI|nr:Translocon at the outer membrane of chloroplasts 64 [Morella rubra]
MASQSANLWVLLGLGLAGILLVTRKLKKVIREDFGAFIEKFQLLPPPPPAPPKAPHPLTGLTFAVSDVFDIDGHITGFGHPDWVKTHEKASWTSPVVSSLVEGGATCSGKTVVDELAYGITGENRHYGTPTNPAVPARVSGGSSSGAAVAVAADLVDFSLGFRPSHGAVSHVGIIPISTSLDTVGCFAKDPNILRRVGHVLLQLPYAVQRSPKQIIIADDCFQLLKIPVDRVAQVVIKSTEKLFGRQVLKHENIEDYVKSKVPSLKELHSKKSNDPAISAQIYETVEAPDAVIEDYKSIRDEMRSAINSLLKDDGVLVLPTIADPPPKLGGKEILSEDFQSRAYSLLSIASRVTIPLGLHNKCPVSVSLIARHGGDRFLLDTVQTMYTSLQEQADIASKTKLSRNAISKEESAEIAKEKGNQAFKDKQWQKAIGFYTEAIKLSSTNATYYSNRALAYLEMGSYLQAEADCTQAITFDKKVTSLS